MLMESSPIGLGRRKVEGERQLLGEGQCLLPHTKRLLRIAEDPQDEGQVGPTPHRRVLSTIQGTKRAVLVGIVEGHGLFEMPARLDQWPYERQERPLAI